MNSLDAFAVGKLERLEAQNLRRTLVETQRLDGVHVRRAGCKLISFSCNDYLNLSQDGRVRAAAQAAIAEHGAGACASRLVTGDHPLVEALEGALADFHKTDAACVFGSGYLANAGIIPTLMGTSDLILLDQLVHACIWAGAQLSGARVLAFAHNDLAALQALLHEHRSAHGRCLIATDGVFSMDGDVAPVGEMAAVADAHDAWLLVDDAHGVGVLNNGRGAAANCSIPLRMGTLSKALGSYGGYVCASRPVIDFIKTRARTLVYSTALPPASAAAALCALNIIAGDSSLVERPLAHAQLFTQRMDLAPAASSIVPVIVGDAARALQLSAALEEDGFLVGAIRPPTVPAGTARLRVTFSALHTPDMIEALAKSMRRHLQALPA